MSMNVGIGNGTSNIVDNYSPSHGWNICSRIIDSCPPLNRSRVLVLLHDCLIIIQNLFRRHIDSLFLPTKFSNRGANYPTPLPDYATLKKWECLDSATGEALAEAVRKDHLPDFSNWKN